MFAGFPVTVSVFGAILVLTGTMRLVELTVSARRWRVKRDALIPEPALFPVMALLHVGLVAAPWLEVIELDRPFRPWLAAAAGATLALATALRVWTLRTIGPAWNVRVVKPAATAIVTSGPYAFVRHPNYVAVIAEIAALPLLHGAWISCAVLSAVNAIVLWRRIRVEERVLNEVPAWREAMQRRARLLPGVF